jgi:hypothetical protein
MPSGYVDRLPTDLLVDTGILKVGAKGGATAILGVSRGGLQFDPGNTLREVEYDGRRAPVELLDRKSFMRPRITGTMLLAAQEDFAYYEAGSTTATAGTPAVHTVTPRAADSLMATGDYKKVELVFNRSGGGTVTITFPSALFVKYGPITGTDQNEGEVAVEIEARQIRSDGSSTDGETLYTIAVADPA